MHVLLDNQKGMVDNLAVQSFQRALTTLPVLIVHCQLCLHPPMSVRRKSFRSLRTLFLRFTTTLGGDLLVYIFFSHLPYAYSSGELTAIGSSIIAACLS
jgi:hypothetical protein